MESRFPRGPVGRPPRIAVMERLIAISNRTTTTLDSQAGGLAVAVGQALARHGGLWFGWSGDVADEPTRGLRVFSEGNVEFALVDLSEEEFEGYYLGYANRAIWPVFHYRIDLMAFRERDFSVYEEVNRRFARLLRPRLRDGDTVWIHDYHFLLLAEALRREGWDGPIGFFLHVPFPPPEVFKALSEHARLARGLSTCDLVGFQTERHAANFRRYLVEEHGGVAGDDGAVEVFGRTVHARAYPIGVDADEFARLAEGEEAQAAAGRLQNFLIERDLILGVDRMDYSKGLPQRFEAVGQMFDHYPDTRGRVSFTQIAPPSRSKVDEYRELHVKLDQLAGRINGDYGDLDWIPIRYLARGYPRAELAGLFRLARIGLVTPLHDGMNLVAKEYVAAQDPADPGVLVLSEFAGAATQLHSALLVNPHDPSSTADTLYRALGMPLEERLERHSTLLRSVRELDVEWWRGAYLDDLGAVSASSST